MSDEQQVCPNCGSFNRAGARFCSKCGHVFKPSTVVASPTPPAQAPSVAPKPTAAHVPAAGVSLCPNCGKEVSSDTRFCRHCGHPLGATQPGAAPAATVAPASATASRATPAAPSSAAPNKQAATGDDDVTQPLVVKSAPPQPVAPAKVTPRPAPELERGAPSWLWALVGLLIGILLGAGSVLAAPGFVGLERVAVSVVTPAALPTDASTPGAPSTAEVTTPLNLPTPTAAVVATIMLESSPAAPATATLTVEATSATVAPPVETEAPPTTAADSAPTAPPADAPAAATEAITDAADVATPETLSISTPLAP